VSSCNVDYLFQTKKKISAIKIKAANIGIQKGDNTHHQLHVIYPVSLRVTKINPSIPNKGKCETYFTSDIIIAPFIIKLPEVLHTCQVCDL